MIKDTFFNMQKNRKEKKTYHSWALICMQLFQNWQNGTFAGDYFQLWIW